MVGSSAALLAALGLVVVVSAAQGPAPVSFPSAALLGEERARSLGVSVSNARAALLAVVAALAGVAVAVSGIIHFVGLIVPHIVRLVVGYDHRLVVPLSGLAGAAFVVAADTLARTLIQPGELRVGIITSALGAPFFIYLIARGRRERQPV